MQRNFTRPNENKGVYYSSGSYAGFWTRVFAWTIDLIFLSFLIGTYLLAFSLFSSGTLTEFNVFLLISFLSCHFYLTVVKTSEKSTLGFWLNNIKVVDLHGKKPSLYKMSVRFLLLSIGPFEFFTDLLWLTGEKTRQTLRDKFVGTYVVKKNAEPVGEGEIVEARLCVLGWNLLFREVAIPGEFSN